MEDDTASVSSPAVHSFMSVIVNELCATGGAPAWLPMAVGKRQVTVSAMGIVRAAPDIMHNPRWGEDCACSGGEVVALLRARTQAGQDVAAGGAPASIFHVPDAVFPSLLAASILGTVYGGAFADFPNATHPDVAREDVHGELRLVTAGKLAEVVSEWADTLHDELRPFLTSWHGLEASLPRWSLAVREEVQSMMSALKMCGKRHSAEHSAGDRLRSIAQMAHCFHLMSKFPRWHGYVLEILRDIAGDASMATATPDVLRFGTLLLLLDVLVQMLYGKLDEASRSIKDHATHIVQQLCEQAARQEASLVTSVNAAASVAPGAAPAASPILDAYAWMHACLADLHWLVHAASELKQRDENEVVANPEQALRQFFQTCSSRGTLVPWLDVPSFTFEHTITIMKHHTGNLDIAKQRALFEVTAAVQRAQAAFQSSGNPGTVAAAHKCVNVLDQLERTFPGPVLLYDLRATAYLALADEHEAICSNEDARYDALGVAAREAGERSANAAAELAKAEQLHAEAVTKVQQAEAQLQAAQRAVEEVERAHTEDTPEAATAKTNAQAELQAMQQSEACAKTERDTAAAAVHDAKARAVKADEDAFAAAHAAIRPALPAGPAMKALNDIGTVLALRSFVLEAELLHKRAAAITAAQRELARRARIHRGSTVLESILAQPDVAERLSMRHRAISRLLPSAACAL